MKKSEKRRQQTINDGAVEKELNSPSSVPFQQFGGGAPDPDLQTLVQTGLRAHQAGQLPEAETAYLKILDAAPDHADANHLLGMIARQTGTPDSAIRLFNKAIRANPGVAAYHNNLGNAYKDLGRPDDAVDSYHKALAINPDFSEAYGNLGAAYRELGRMEDAVDSYRKALAGNSNFAIAHFNLGNALRAMDQMEDAVESYKNAIAINPDTFVMHENLADTLQALGKLEDAAGSFEKALAIDPKAAETHARLGTLYKQLGRTEDAIASFNRALEINPELAVAHNNLGNVFEELGQPVDAAASYQKALAINPNLAEAHSNLGLALMGQGLMDEAVASYRKAITLAPENDALWAGWADCLKFHTFSFADDSLFQDLLSLLNRSVVRPQAVCPAIATGLVHHPDIAQLLARLRNEEEFEKALSYRDTAERLSKIPLLLRTMALCGINNIEMEKLLTDLRRTWISEISTNDLEFIENEKSLPFSTALARQCFTNEYVFFQTPYEEEVVGELWDQTAAQLENGHHIPAAVIAALGAYRPLCQLPSPERLLKRQWADVIRDVIVQQVAEPLEERNLRSEIPNLTPVHDVVSRAVRRQYEESPFPRWINTSLTGHGRTIGGVLRGAPFRFNLGDYRSPEEPDILIAGCGTGQHALRTADRFLNARILAVDLSLNSLAYALRKTAEMGISNIDYAQGDILELESLDRQFDLIECAGVLHHMDDPVAGWRILTGLLHTGGFIKIALYSEIARQDIIKARAMIAEKGYVSTAKDIRRCRQEIIALAEAGDPDMEKLVKTGDFFSLSTCRDLLFHVQEHRFTVPKIETALEELGLEFLGFELDSAAHRKFQQSHPENGAQTPLSLWHRFETENPDTFRVMYQFWARKA